MDTRACFETLSASSSLDVFLPKTPNLDAAALLRDGKGEQLAQAPARRNLFFDEEVAVLILLRTSTREAEVRHILPDLELVLGAHATDAVPQGGGNAASASGKYDVSSKCIAANTFVDIVPHGGKTYVIWQSCLHLPRPRARLQRPAIYFTANVLIRANPANANVGGKRNDYLENFEPLPSNVLEPLHFDPALAGSKIYLPEPRITKVAPKTPALRDALKPIRGASKRAFPTIPAVFSKIRFSAVSNIFVASLHVEPSRFMARSIVIDSASLETPDAHVEHLNDSDCGLDMEPGDESVFLYRITPIRHDGVHEAEASIAVSIIAHTDLEQGSRIEFRIGWQTQMDLNRSITKPLYTWSRPLSSASGHHRGHSAQSNPAVGSETSRETDDTPSRILFSFTAEPKTRRNSDFQMRVLCHNRSNRQRRFALLMLKSRKPRLQSKTSELDADLISSMFNRPSLDQMKAPDVLDLNSDVRIGPIPPDAHYETHMTFRALNRGVLDLGILRILDLDTRQIVDIKELPDIVSLELETALDLPVD